MSAAVTPAVEAAEAHVRTQAVVHPDETGSREHGERRWLWTATAGQVSVFCIDRRRGADVAKRLLGEDFGGVAVSDRWCGYNWLDVSRRQLRWAHLNGCLRDPQALGDDEARREVHVLYPYGRSPSRREPCATDRWAGPGWRLLERHELHVRATAAAAVEAVASTTLAEIRAVRALFALRGLRFSKEMTLRAFFSTRPFVWLEEDVDREAVFGVLIPPSGPGGRKRPTSPAAFREVLGAAPFAALGTFRAEPEGQGARLWTETWSRTRGATPSLIFGTYWLAIGPWSAWIRRMFLRAARVRAEGQA